MPPILPKDLTRYGRGSPLSVIVARIGTIYHNLTGSSNTAAFLKESGEDSSGWKAILTTSHTDAADPHSGYILESLLDAKGDLIAASAADTPAKVTVGGNGGVLVANSAATPGVSYSDTYTGPLFLNDTANANMTTGLTLNQGAADNTILAFKSSDVAHGITDQQETDTYGWFGKADASAGGAGFNGATEDTIGISIAGMATNDNTTKSAAALANFYLAAYKKSGTTVGAHGADANILALVQGGTGVRFLFDVEAEMYMFGTTTTDKIGNGTWYLNDSSNADITLGLTLNQGANDNQILAMKSSDVAHGMTTVAETDTFGYLQKQDANAGGLIVRGLSDTNAYALQVEGIGTGGNTTKSTGALAALILGGAKANGTGIQALGSTDNMVVMRDASSGNARFIFQADGTSYEDVGTAWVNYDDHDDVGLLHLASAHLAREGNPIREDFLDWLERGREPLERLGLVIFNDHDGHHFVNRSRMQELTIGAIRQIDLRLRELERRLLAA